VINLRDWPPQSPDPNPIENLWGWLTEEVKKKNPKTVGELRASLLKNWEKMSLEFLQNYIESVCAHINLCTERQGKDFIIKQL